jgi:hypothetical protein
VGNVTKSVFWRITLSSPVKVTDISKGHIALIFTIENYAREVTSMKQAASTDYFIMLSYCSTLKMEGIHSSEISFDFH